MIILKKEKNTYDKFIISKDGEEAKEFHKGALVRRKMFLADHNLFNVREKFQFLPGIKQLMFSQKHF